MPTDMLFYLYQDHKYYFPVLTEQHLCWNNLNLNKYPLIHQKRRQVYVHFPYTDLLFLFLLVSFPYNFHSVFPVSFQFLLPVFLPLQKISIFPLNFHLDILPAINSLNYFPPYILLSILV